MPTMTAKPRTLSRFLPGVLLVLLLSSPLASVVTAADTAHVGVVVAVRGTVELLRPESQPRQLVLKDTLLQKDTVKTGRRGRVQLVFEDDTIISLGRNTEMEITEFLFEPSDGKGAMVTTVKEGVFRVMGGAITKIAPDSFKTNTPTATIGIRGSLYVGEATGDETTAALVGTDGQGIYVENGEGRTDVTEPGEGATVRRGEPPSQSRPMGSFVSARLGDTSVGGTDAEGEGRDQQPPPQQDDDDDDDDDAPPPADDDDDDDDDDAPPPGDDDDGDDDAPTPGSPGDDTDNESTFTGDGETTTGQETNQDVEEAAQGVLVTLSSGYFIGQDRQKDWVFGVEAPDEVSVDVNVKQGTVYAVKGGRTDLVTESNTSPPPGTSQNSAPPPSPESPELHLVITPDSQLELSAEEAQKTDAVVARGSAISVAQEPKSYMVWGYWGVNYHAPNDPSNHSQISGVWAATDRLMTSIEHLRDVLLGGDFTGDYNGDAHCLVDRGGASTASLDPLDGSAHLEVKFADKAFSGWMDFSNDGGPKMITKGSVSESGLLGRITEINDITGISVEDVTKSGVRGSFYDEDASKVIGSFNAVTPENVYIGVFGVQGTVAPGTTTNTP